MREISYDSISVFLQVKWHPSKEGLLAFGADDGQVGVYNIISKKCVSMLIGHLCVFSSLCWSLHAHPVNLLTLEPG